MSTHKDFTAIRLPQRFQYCRRDGKNQWLDGICVPISDGRWKVMWYDGDGNSGQSRVITGHPPSIPLSNGPHWLHRWIDDDYGWCNENTTDMRCCGQLFRDTDELRDHIFNDHNSTQQEVPTMTFPERDHPQDNAEYYAALTRQQAERKTAFLARAAARQTAKHKAAIAARQAEAARLAAIEREGLVSALAKDLLLKLASVETTSPVEFLPGQAFAMADRFYAERDRRAEAIKSE